MYIRRKAFSVAVDENGEERYFSTNEIIKEEDYLEELMYSEDANETKKSSGVGGGLVGAGAGLVAGGAAGIGVAAQGKKYKQAKSLINNMDIGSAKIRQNNWWGTDVQGCPKNFDRLKKVVHTKHGIVRKGALAGGAIGAAALGTAGYLYAKNKKKNKE